MKLDHEIVRHVLLTVERDHQGPDWELVIPNSDFASFYAADKLLEGGFVKAEIVPGSDEDEAIHVTGLTYSGHVFLDTIRDPKAWTLAKKVARKAGSMSVQSLFSVAQAQLIERLSA